MRLNVKTFALICGAVWSILLVCITLWIILSKGQTRAKTLIGKVYRGYNISYPGCIIGGIWAFFDGLIGGALFAWLYNMFIGKRSKIDTT